MLDKTLKTFVKDALVDYGVLRASREDIEHSRVDDRERVVHLSPIFKWYGAEFEKQSGSVLAALKPYWPEEAAAALGTGDFKIRYTDYDWSLNEQSK